MSLNNDTIQHPLPGNLQSRVENALNLVTSLEAEADRLRKLISNYKSEVNSLHAEKKYIEEQIEKLKTDVETYKKQIQDANVTLVDVHGKISGANKELEESVSLKQQTLETVRSKSEDVARRLQEIEKAEESLKERHAIQLSRETEHENRVERLKKAME